MRPRSLIWNESLDASDPLREYDLDTERTFLSYANADEVFSPSQIRIVVNTHENDNKDSKKKKKKHRGYAFIVYEREKDMKGIHSHPLPAFPLH